MSKNTIHHATFIGGLADGLNSTIQGDDVPKEFFIQHHGDKLLGDKFLLLTRWTSGANGYKLTETTKGPETSVDIYCHRYEFYGWHKPNYTVTPTNGD